MDVLNLRKKWLIGLMLGLIVFAGFGIWGDYATLKNSFQSFKWGYFPLIFLFTFMGYLLRFAKWEVYLRTLRIRIRPTNSLIVFFSGLSMAITPGKAGEVLKSFLLKKIENIEITRSAPVVFAERVTDLFAMIFLASMGLSRFPYGGYLLAGTFLFLAILIVLIQSRTLFNRFLTFLRKYPRFDTATEKLAILYDSTSEVLRLRVLAVTTAISIVSWFFECISLYFVLKGFGFDSTIIDSAFIFSFSSIAGAVSMLPGGLGVAETSMVGILMGLGFEKAGAVAATMMGRFGTLWFGVIVGLIVLLLNSRKFRVFG